MTTNINYHHIKYSLSSERMSSFISQNIVQILTDVNIVYQNKVERKQISNTIILKSSLTMVVCLQ